MIITQFFFVNRPRFYTCLASCQRINKKSRKENLIDVIAALNRPITCLRHVEMFGSLVQLKVWEK